MERLKSRVCPGKFGSVLTGLLKMVASPVGTLSKHPCYSGTGDPWFLCFFSPVLNLPEEWKTAGNSSLIMGRACGFLGEEEID